ncbi:MAG: HAMP domain-containing histidine kinase [Lachnospiraceae bacterium]|nr:HAMP domain-containing histidine kinase [Lachnospiraceae bacterium]
MKKNKNSSGGWKIPSFLLRMLFLAAVMITFITGIAAKSALLAASEFGSKTLSGDIFYLPEFRAHMDELIENLLLGYVGLEEEDDSKPGALRFRSRFLQQITMSNHDIIYHIDAPELEIQTNHGHITESESGELQLPDGYRIYLYWDGPNERLSYLADNMELSSEAVYSNFTDQGINEERFSQTRFILGVRQNSRYLGPYMYALYTRAEFYHFVLIYLISALAVTLTLGLLCLLTRKHAKTARVSYSHFSKKIWLELKLLVFGLAIWSLYAGYSCWANLETPDYIWSDFIWLPALSGLLFYLLYADIRQNKGDVFRNSIPVKIFLFIKEYQQSEPWHRKIMRHCFIILLSAILTAGMGIYMLTYSFTAFGKTGTYYRYSHIEPLPNRLLLGLLGCLLLIIAVYLFRVYVPIRRFTKDTRAISERLANLQPGFPAEPLKLSERSPLQETAENINRLEYNIENAVEQKNRSNRMRVELITNVSHDLKTPLTSIINYADLLCEEELSAPAAEYAVSLRDKAYRLRNMVQDVFELSKAASGNLRIDKQPLDLAKLIRQTLADMDERISDSSLTFKTVMETDPVMILADGEKLYRVFQNLFLNALQYSLENSRVHVLLTVKDGFAQAKIKNTSREELSFDPDEIVERFVRADTSRTGEGSGLGLSIAQSFTEACGGTFSIDLDADMFSACVSFPLIEVTLPEDGASS